MVLFPYCGSEPAVLRADCVHNRRATAGKCFGDTVLATWQSIANDQPLSRRPAGTPGPFAAFSFSAAEVVGKHGRAPRRFSGWTNAGERRPVVFDGAGAQTLPLAGRIAFGDDRIRNGALDGAGVLDCS